MKISIEQRLNRLGQWFNRKNDRPLLGFYLDSQYPLHRFEGSRKHLLNGKVTAEDIVVEDYLDDCDRLYELYDEAGGDLIWSSCPFFGLPWVEAALGCGVIADHTTGSSRSVPPAGFADKPIVAEFSVDNPWVAKMLEFFPALVERSTGRYPVGVTLMRGISDLLSALYGGEEAIIRMYERPDEVLAVVEKLTDFSIAFGQCMMDHVPLFHGGTGSFFYSLWCPAKTIWLQEDAAALLSPKLYEQFIHPHYCRIVKTFEHSVVHLHPSKFSPVDYLLAGKTSVIEMHIDKGGPTAEDLCNTHRKILEQKPLLIWGDLSDADLEFVLKYQPYKGLAINIVVSSPQQASAIWEKAYGLWSAGISKI